MLFWAVDLFAANPGTGTDQANDCEERESKQLRGRGRINCRTSTRRTANTKLALIFAGKSTRFNILQFLN